MSSSYSRTLYPEKKNETKLTTPVHPSDSKSTKKNSAIDRSPAADGPLVDADEPGVHRRLHVAAVEVADGLVLDADVDPLAAGRPAPAPPTARAPRRGRRRA